MPEDGGEAVRKEGGGPQVLVVGAGPVGLTAAHELVRRGVRVRLVDKAEGPAPTSRATATHARTLEICHQMGILDRLLPRGQQVRHFSIHKGGRRLVRFDTNYDRLPTRYPFSLMVDQVITEEVIRGRLSELGIDVEWGVALESFEQDAHRVSARLVHGDGSAETVDVPWMVGTDGAHSSVRKRLGLRLLGDSTETWMNADIVVDSDLQRDSNHLLHTGKGTILLVPFPDPGKWRAVDTVDVDGVDDWEIVRKRMESKISAALGRHTPVSAPTWVSRFTAQQRMIQQMRSGRCFVAGDAAHVHSPASGQGMNTGIQDAYNLAWKLADVVNGHAGQGLLDSYSAERVPIGEKLLGSTRTATTLVALRNTLAPVALPIGGLVLNTVKPLKRKIEGKIIRGFCGLAIGYPDTPLRLGADAPEGETVFVPGQRVGCSLETERAEQGWAALCAEELPDSRWTLLAFTEDSDTGDGVRRVLKHAEECYSEAISVRTVSGGGDATGPRPMADPRGALRKSMGARVGDFALIRPDGYFAGTGRLLDTDDLDRALSGLHLSPRGQAAAS